MRWRSEDKHSKITHRCAYKNMFHSSRTNHIFSAHKAFQVPYCLKSSNITCSSYLQVSPVDLVNDVEVSRQQVLEEVHRPALQCLRQHGVVGVGTGSDHNIPGLDTEARATGS